MVMLLLLLAAMLVVALTFRTSAQRPNPVRMPVRVHRNRNDRR
ncbi:MAG: hypothetical protein OHK0022_47650 [Roseiflexaceae bacterium]